MHTHTGISLLYAGWVETREPHQLRRLIVALIQFVMMWGRGIRSLNAVTVQGEGVVNVVESGLVQVASSGEQVSDNCTYYWITLELLSCGLLLFNKSVYIQCMYGSSIVKFVDTIH